MSFPIPTFRSCGLDTWSCYWHESTLTWPLPLFPGHSPADGTDGGLTCAGAQRILDVCNGGVMNLRRLLLTLEGRHCPFGCSYCFATFKAYSRPLSLEAVERDPSQLEGIDVVYPACDIDLFACSDAIDVLERTAALGRSISVSTKAAISAERTKRIASIAKRMPRGSVLKIGASFSTKKRLAEIEPRTADYASRIRTLRFLSECGVTTSLVLKPVRAEIPASEYCEIIRDAELFTRMVLVGEEYLDPDGPDVSAETRAVTWLPSSPRWPVRATPEQLRVIADYADSRGLECFSSDLQ